MALSLIMTMLIPMVRFYSHCRMRNHVKLIESQMSSLLDKAFVHTFLCVKERLSTKNFSEDWTETGIVYPDLFLYSENGIIRFINCDYTVKIKNHVKKDDKEGWLIDLEVTLVLSEKLRFSCRRDVFFKL